MSGRADLFRPSQVVRPIAGHVPYARSLIDGGPIRSLLLLCKAGKTGDGKRAQCPAIELLDVEVVGDSAGEHDIVVLLEVYDWRELIKAVDKLRRQTRGYSRGATALNRTSY